jgi:hypothetical protein
LLGNAQVIQVLQVEPEVWAGTEETCQAQGRVSGDGALGVQKGRDAIGWDAKLPRKLGCAYTQFLQFLGQVFSGMDGD